MKYVPPTTKNVVAALDSILKKECDSKTRAKVFLALVKVMEEDSCGFKLAVIRHIDELLS